MIPMSPVTKLTFALLLTGSLTLSPPLAAAEGSETAALALQEVPGSSAADGLHFLGADKKGRVFVLNSESLEVRAVTPEGTGEAFELTGEKSFDRPGAVVAASMGGSASEWLVRTGAYTVSWFRNERLVPTPDSSWVIHDVVLAKGDPVLAVVPVGHGGGWSAGSEPPLLLARTGQRWTTLVESEPPSDPNFRSEDMKARSKAQREMRWRRSVDLRADDQGKIWVGTDNGYKLEEYSPGGRLLTTLTVGNPEMEIIERPAEEQEEILAQFEAMGRRPPKNLGALSQMPRMVIMGFTVGDDGKLYILNQTDEGIALDRWDGVASRLERVSVATDLPARKFSVTAGADGLYLATLVASGGIWHVPTDLLRTASWTPVPGAQLNGTPLPTVAPQR